MSEHSCPVVTVDEIREHPDADRLEIARIFGYELVVAKNTWQPGQEAVYIPEQSIVPQELLEELGLTGKLAGPDMNRVKAIRLRGVLSQGLLAPLTVHTLNGRAVTVGDDMSETLQIDKWVPDVPSYMNGIVQPATWTTSFTDIEPWQKTPERISDDVAVQISEKLHGTFCIVGYDRDNGPYAASKNMAGKTAFVLDSPENEHNVYVAAWRQQQHTLEELADEHGGSVAVAGEIVGPKIQDMTYSLKERELFVFDMHLDGAWAGTGTASASAAQHGMAHVPVVQQRIRHDHDEAVQAAQQPSLIDGGLREGVVVRPCEPDWDSNGRVILKYVNPAYLTRRHGTERQ